jgi:hypothetical protein
MVAPWRSERLPGHGASAYVGRQALTAVQLLAPRQLALSLGGYRIDLGLREANCLHDITVEHAPAT